MAGEDLFIVVEDLVMAGSGDEGECVGFRHGDLNSQACECN